MSNLEITTRMLQLTETIETSIDPDFDLVLEELEREFSELRLMIDHN